MGEKNKKPILPYKPQYDEFVVEEEDEEDEVETEKAEATIPKTSPLSDPISLQPSGTPKFPHSSDFSTTIEPGKGSETDDKPKKLATTKPPNSKKRIFIALTRKQIEEHHDSVESEEGFIDATSNWAKQDSNASETSSLKKKYGY